MLARSKKNIDTKFLELLSPSGLNRDTILDGETIVAWDQLASKYNIWMLFYVQLQKHAKDPAKHKAVKKFLEQNKQRWLKLIGNCLFLEVVEKEVLELLSQHNFAAVVFKGRAIAKDIYGDQNSRASGDIDILIKCEDIFFVDELLRENGYSRQDDVPLAFQVTRLHHTTYVHHKWKFPIEVHWHFSIPSFFLIDSDEIWQDIVQNRDGKWHLSPEMMMTMLLMHHHMHAFKQLRSIVDFMWAFHLYSKKIDWMEFGAKIKKRGLVKTTMISINQIHALWDMEDDRLESVQKLKGLLSNNKTILSGLTSHYFNNPFGAKNYITKGDMVFQRLTLDKLKTILRSFYKSFFPTKAEMEALFDGRHESGFFVMYLQFIRWRLQEWLITSDRKMNV